MKDAKWVGGGIVLIILLIREWMVWLTELERGVKNVVLTNPLRSLPEVASPAAKMS